MSDYCEPPGLYEEPGLIFDVHEKCIDSRLPPGSNTFDNDLGPFQDPIEFLIPSFFVYSFSTTAITKTLSLKGPPVPIWIAWKHHSVTGFVDTITDAKVELTEDSPSNTWPEGYEHPGEDPEEYRAEYDDNFAANRAV